MTDKRDERWITSTKLLRALRMALRETRDTRDSDNRDAMVVERIKQYLASQPDQPPLVGVTVAAQILGVKKPRIMRFRDQGRLPKVIEVDGGHPAYLRNEIEAMLPEVEARRARYAQRAIKRLPNKPGDANELMRLAGNLQMAS